eukprot:5372404-Prymnesium_polylepis.1
MLVDPENQPWKSFYRHQLWKHYRHIAPPDGMLASNDSFQRIVQAPAGTVTDICRRAFRAWGQLPVMTQTPKKEVTQAAAANMLLFHHAA